MVDFLNKVMTAIGSAFVVVSLLMTTLVVIFWAGIELAIAFEKMLFGENNE